MPQGRSVVGFIGLGDNDGRGMSQMRAAALRGARNIALFRAGGSAAAGLAGLEADQVRSHGGSRRSARHRSAHLNRPLSQPRPACLSSSRTGRAPGAISRPPLSPRPRPTGTRSWSPGLIKPSIRRFCPIPALTTSAISRRYRWSCKPKCCLWPAPAFLVTTSPTSSGSRRKNRNRSASQFQRSARPIISARKC